ncbi:hypothetical protein QBC43DRAFT_305966 [Cladorrhinum sp. PSN259]|nr:hypothetical protein QBC43DRAFT_305966 [Cladorrhinum sp. PSN259]
MAGRRRHPPASSRPTSPAVTHPGELTTWSPNLLNSTDIMIPLQFVPVSPQENKDELTTWSPSFLGGSTRRLPRRLVTIPTDQADALEHASVWGRNHVPLKVLEEAQARHSRGISRSIEALAPQIQPHDEPSSQPASPLGYKTVAQREVMNEVEMNRGAEDEEEPSMPWSSSPPDHFQNPRLLQDMVMDTDSSSSDPTQQLSNEQLPEPVQNQPVYRPQLQPALLVEFPPESSQPSDAGFAAEPPNSSMTQLQGAPIAAPLSNLPSLDPTPPSAQIIPATLPRAESTSPERATKRRRLMKNVGDLLQSPGHGARRPSVAFGVEKSADHMLAPPSGSVHDLTRANESSSYETQPPEETSPVTATPVLPRGHRLPTLADQVKIITATPASVQQPESSRSSDRLPPNKTYSQDPHNMFCEEYPDYGGSLNMFLRAIISLEEQQKRMVLSEFLYDDYVRVFSGPYFEYIGSCVEECIEQPLTTIQWYNKNVKVPVYMKRHLTVEKVKEILRYYPDRIREIREQATGGRSSSIVKKRQETKTHVVKDIPQPERAVRREASLHTTAGNTASSLPTRPSPRKATAVDIGPEAEAPIHRAELASDPISTAEDFSPITKSRYKATRKLDLTPSFRPSGISAARRVIREDIESTDPRNQRISPPSAALASPGFATQVVRRSLDLQSSLPAVIEDTKIINDDDDVQEATEAQEKAAGTSSLQPTTDEQSSQIVGVKRPWEAIEGFEARAEVQLKYWEVFLEKVYLPRRRLFFEHAEEAVAE